MWRSNHPYSKSKKQLQCLSPVEKGNTGKFCQNSRICSTPNQENKNMKPGAIYQNFSFFPSKDAELAGEYAIHQCIAGFHFYITMAK